MRVDLERRAEIGASRRRRTLNKMLRSIVETLSQRPYNTITIDEFVSAGRVSKGTFYNYFSSKAEISDALVTLIDLVVRNALMDVMPKNARAIDRLAMFATGYLEFGSKAPNYALIPGQQYLDAHPKFPTHIQAMQDMLFATMQEAVADGDLSPVSRNNLIDSVMPSSLFMVKRIAIAPEKEHPSLIYEGVVQLLRAKGATRATAQKYAKKSMSKLPLANLLAIEPAIEQTTDIILGRG